MVAEDPMREERWRLLVLALYRAQRQADALGALRRARNTLADESASTPGPALRALEAEVLAQSPSLDAPVRPASPASGRAVHHRPVAGRPRRPGPGAGRAVRAALDDLAAGERRLLLIEGPAGIGKTRLLAEARRLAAEEVGAGSDRPGQPAGAGVRLRCRAPAVRAGARATPTAETAARRDCVERPERVRPGRW